MAKGSNKRFLKSQITIRHSSVASKKSASKRKGLGVLTGGGDCPGLNAAIRAVVRRAHLDGVPVWGVLRGFQGLYQDQIVAMRPIDAAGIISTGGTILGTSRFNPLHQKDGVKKIKAVLKMKNISCLVTIGGEGTQRCANELQKAGIPCVGVPKTIDNDVYGTDFTFGFDTAVTIATEAIDRLHTTAESHNRVMLIEVMGRHTGWIATLSGIAGGGRCHFDPRKGFSLEPPGEYHQDPPKSGKAIQHCRGQ